MRVCKTQIDLRKSCQEERGVAAEMAEAPGSLVQYVSDPPRATFSPSHYPAPALLQGLIFAFFFPDMDVKDIPGEITWR